MHLYSYIIQYIAHALQSTPKYSYITEKHSSANMGIGFIQGN